MPSSEQTLPRRHDARPEYTYRRQLGLIDLVPAIGIGVGAGLFAYYVTRLLLQRTPLRIERGDVSPPRPRPGARRLDRSTRP